MSCSNDNSKIVNDDSGKEEGLGIVRSTAKGNDVRVRKLISKVQDPNSLGEALVVAAQNGYTRTVGVLFDSGRIETPYLVKALIRAAQNGRENVVGVLSESMEVVDIGEALLNATKAGNSNAVRNLLAIEKPIYDSLITQAFLSAVNGGHTETVSTFISCWRGVKYRIGQELIEAAGGGHVEAFNVLLNYARDAYSDFIELALIEAVWGRHVDIIKAIIGVKKDINDYYINKALSIATKRGYSDIIEILKEGTNLQR